MIYSFWSGMMVFTTMVCKTSVSLNGWMPTKNPVPTKAKTKSAYANVSNTSLMIRETFHAIFRPENVFWPTSQFLQASTVVVFAILTHQFARRLRFNRWATYLCVFKCLSVSKILWTPRKPLHGCCYSFTAVATCFQWPHRVFTKTTSPPHHFFPFRFCNNWDL